MLVVLDTNVFLSALHSDSGPPGEIVDCWRAGRFRLVTSAEQIEEFKRAASYPRLRARLPRRAVGHVVKQLHKADMLLERLRRSDESPDPGDDYLLAMAAAAGADYLVTGDKTLLGVQRIATTRIVSVRRFAAILAR